MEERTPGSGLGRVERGVVAKVLKRGILVVLGLLLAALVLEMSLSAVGAEFIAIRSMPIGRTGLPILEADEAYGFLPKLGPEEHYGTYGCLYNEYNPEQRQDRKRILFVGDSVIHRGRLVSGIRATYGEEAFEYWNAGVEGFTTAQELELYKRANRALRPDEVILTFHNNDFQATPVAIANDGEIRLHFSDGPRGWRWLENRSILYRWAILWLARTEISSEEMSRNLAEFKALVEADGARFSVILFPVLRPADEWTAAELESRQKALQVFKELELRDFDLLESTTGALAAGVELQETPGDHWHPSDAAGVHFGRTLKRMGLLESRP